MRQMTAGRRRCSNRQERRHQSNTNPKANTVYKQSSSVDDSGGSIASPKDKGKVKEWSK